MNEFEAAVALEREAIAKRTVFGRCAGVQPELRNFSLSRRQA
jgi:hypothetical protein